MSHKAKLHGQTKVKHSNSNFLWQLIWGKNYCRYSWRSVCPSVCPSVCQSLWRSALPTKTLPLSLWKVTNTSYCKQLVSCVVLWRSLILSCSQQRCEHMLACLYHMTRTDHIFPHSALVENTVNKRTIAFLSFSSSFNSVCELLNTFVWCSHSIYIYTVMK